MKSSIQKQNTSKYSKKHTIKYSNKNCNQLLKYHGLYVKNFSFILGMADPLALQLIEIEIV